MEKIKELRLNALDNLGAQVANIGTELDKMAADKNDWDAEARVYVIHQFAHRLARSAKRIHEEMHTENSKDHPHLCEQTSDKGVFDYIFGKGTLPFVIALAIFAFTSPAGAWEFDRNPDRFISVGLTATRANLDGNSTTTLPGGAFAGSTDNEVKTRVLGADVRIPVHQSLTLSVSYERLKQDVHTNGADNLGSPAYIDGNDQSGQRYGASIRYYFNK